VHDRAVDIQRDETRFHRAGRPLATTDVMGRMI
jgi:hypothetical protein